VDALGPVDGDNVRMPDARQQAPFLDDSRRVAARFVSAKNLEGDLAIESSIPGPVHVSERPPSNLFDDAERAPLLVLALCVRPARLVLRDVRRRGKNDAPRGGAI